MVIADPSPNVLRSTAGSFLNLYGLRAKVGKMEPKPAYRSTEFWLSLLAVLVGCLLSSGALDPADPTQATILRVAGFVATVLTALGYTVSRSLVKSTEAKAAAFKLPPT